MKDLGFHNFLGMEIKRTADGMSLSQPGYIQKLLEKYGMEECRPIDTPIEEDPPRCLAGPCIVGSRPYRELIGALMYLMLCTRPDISMAVNFFSRYQHNATHAQWLGLVRILRYLKGTKDMGIYFQCREHHPPIECYADADWAGDLNDRLSTSGYLFRVFGNLVMWCTKKQRMVAGSSTEAEYVALGSACTELIWFKNLMRHLVPDLQLPIAVYEDNTSVISCLQKWEQKRLKSVDVKYHITKQLQDQRIITVLHVPSEHQKADILTKGLKRGPFLRLRDLLGMRSSYLT